eukprot:TRINITY_DN11810_c0_g1_i1.p1 TRINITY_DN11810_c0_g1~~TRINITY_DN11810_c0_g1_i1.p1  ORF type:complete len:502 (-),score=56.08 TRINITY_DN11810_c0_g1_i1:82-1524(-)
MAPRGPFASSQSAASACSSSAHGDTRRSAGRPMSAAASVVSATSSQGDGPRDGVRPAGRPGVLSPEWAQSTNSRELRPSPSRGHGGSSRAASEAPASARSFGGGCYQGVRSPYADDGTAYGASPNVGSEGGGGAVNRSQSSRSVRRADVSFDDRESECACSDAGTYRSASSSQTQWVPQDALPPGSSDWDSASATTATPRERVGGRVNRFVRDNSAGAASGFHGVRLHRKQSNKRLFGNCPNARSNVDEVVFGRDMDFSSDRDFSAELNVLLKMYKGAAGSKGAVGVLVEDQPGITKGPDDPRKLCIVSERKINDRESSARAGKPRQEPRDIKRAWTEHPLKTSNVSEVVFGGPLHGDASDQKFVKQFSHSSGKSTRMGCHPSDEARKKNAQESDLKHFVPARDVPVRRNYNNSPMKVDSVKKLVFQGEQTASPPRELIDHFSHAAGKSPHFHPDQSGRVHVQYNENPNVSVYKSTRCNR